MVKSKLELIELTKTFLNRSDLIQGPGGNTSVKNSDGEMFIKASGFRFDEMTIEKGISAVNYLNIRNYFNTVKPIDKVKEEAEMLKTVSQNILIDDNGEVFPRPSMETGFHAVLEQYVVHTHSVWTNLINCRSYKSNLINKLSQQFNITEIPFVSPGFGLSYLVTDALKQSELAGKNRPDIFLLHNHGVIAHSNSINHCVKLLLDLDKAIMDILGIQQSYPSTEIVGIDGEWIPKSDYVNQLLLKYKSDAEFFEQVLFPDQTVFFKDQILFNQSENTRKISINNFNVVYHCEHRDAKAIHETMTAYLFIFDFLHSNSAEIDFIGKSEIDYINNMDMEKHRKSIK
jgi:ribulose-5-phosphate 4-epimerase/fuculose-1-phosphate aldolase